MKALRRARRSSSPQPQSAGLSARLVLLVDLLCMGPASRVGFRWDLLCTRTGKWKGAASASRLQTPHPSPQRCSACSPLLPYPTSHAAVVPARPIR